MIEPTPCLRIRCCNCNRTAEISLPTDREDLAHQLSSQRWYLVPARPAQEQEAPRLGVVKPLCPICEEAQWHC